MKQEDSSPWLLWISRAFACLLGALWIFFGIAHSLGKPWDWESTVLAGLAALIAVGVLVSWWQPRLGGLVLCACGVLCGVYAYVAAEHYKSMGMLLTGGPVFAAGLLFLWHSWKTKS